MRTAAEHAAWWNAEMRLLWPQAASVIGDRLAHEVVRAGTRGNPDASFFMIDIPFLWTDRHAVVADLHKPPAVLADDGGLLIEIPEGVGHTPFHILDRSHRVTIGSLFLLGPVFPVPMRYELMVGLDASPSADHEGIDLILDSKVSFEVDDWIVRLSGLGHVEDLLRDVRSPFVVGINALAESLFHFGEHPVPGFRRWRFEPRVLTPATVAPEALQSDRLGIEPSDGDRLDWWDIVFVADGFGPADMAQFDQLVTMATDRLLGTSTDADAGAAGISAFGSAIRTWKMALDHATARLTAWDRDPGETRGPIVVSDLAAVADVGLLMDEALAAEYPRSPSAPHRRSDGALGAVSLCA